MFRFLKKLVKMENSQSHSLSLPTFTLAKMRLAAHPHARSASLARLAKSTSPGVQIRVAENANTPPAVLCDLALSESSDVRAAVAENENTPPGAIFLLAADHDADVRYSIAENHNAPLAVLQLLLEDDNPYIACRARSTMKRAGHLSTIAGGEHVWMADERADYRRKSR